MPLSLGKGGRADRQREEDRGEIRENGEKNAECTPRVNLRARGYVPGPRDVNAHFITRLLNGAFTAGARRSVKGQTHLEFEATLPENNDPGVKAMTQIVLLAISARI